MQTLPYLTLQSACFALLLEYVSSILIITITITIKITITITITIIIIIIISLYRRLPSLGGGFQASPVKVSKIKKE